MYSKLLITGEIVVKTGLHIGSGETFAAIGAVDKPVVRDGRSGLPMIPGSSLKGKMRTLLTRAIQNNLLTQGTDKDPMLVKRLFGASGALEKGQNAIPGRLIFSDCAVVHVDEIPFGMLTEVKSENSINRATGLAQPRFIERVVPGVRFGLHIVYEATNEEELMEDFEAIAAAMQLLSMDYLGGHGTRGSGRIAFEKLQVRQLSKHNPLEAAALPFINEQVLNDETVSL